MKSLLKEAASAQEATMRYEDEQEIKARIHLVKLLSIFDFAVENMTDTDFSKLCHGHSAKELLGWKEGIYSLRFAVYQEKVTIPRYGLSNSKLVQLISTGLLLNEEAATGKYNRGDRDKLEEELHGALKILNTPSNGSYQQEWNNLNRHFNNQIVMAQRGLIKTRIIPVLSHQYNTGYAPNWYNKSHIDEMKPVTMIKSLDLSVVNLNEFSIKRLFGDNEKYKIVLFSPPKDEKIIKYRPHSIITDDRIKKEKIRIKMQMMRAEEVFYTWAGNREIRPSASTHEPSEDIIPVKTTITLRTFSLPNTRKKYRLSFLDKIKRNIYVPSRWSEAIRAKLELAYPGANFTTTLPE